MSRTLPRAAGVRPANCVSLKTLMAGADDTEKVPRQSVKHSNAAQREVKRALRKISGKQNKKKLCGGRQCLIGFSEVAGSDLLTKRQSFLQADADFRRSLLLVKWNGLRSTKGKPNKLLQ